MNFSDKLLYIDLVLNIYLLFILTIILMVKDLTNYRKDDTLRVKNLTCVNLKVTVSVHTIQRSIMCCDMGIKSSERFY